MSKYNINVLNSSYIRNLEFEKNTYLLKLIKNHLKRIHFLRTK